MTEPKKSSSMKTDATMQAPIRIGVFDSGFGGLTVLRALLQTMPPKRLPT